MCLDVFKYNVYCIHIYTLGKREAFHPHFFLSFFFFISFRTGKGKQHVGVATVEPVRFVCGSKDLGWDPCLSVFIQFHAYVGVIF